MPNAPFTDFQDRIAVVTGGATGMGRELVAQLAGLGCHVAACDVDRGGLDESVAAAAAANPDRRITAHTCDVSDEDAMDAFRDEVRTAHGDAVHLLFNNAGISGGGSFVLGERADWDRTFGICWGGVYLGCRVFMPMLLAADEGVVINTSSVNGFWASLGPQSAHTAYAAAKFAVKGFTEALIGDFRNNAPHLRAVVVMPGHIGTDIARKSMLAGGADETQAEALGAMFRDNAPMSAAEAASEMIDAVRTGQWRVLLGDDARRLDEAVRADPWTTYDLDGAVLGGIFRS